MKKVVALVMTFIVVGLAFDTSCLETRAAASGIAESNYLLWTYLNTMFTATAGKQASDTTTNDSTKNYNLYRDFIDFCDETSENVSTVAKIEITTAKYGYVKMRDAIDEFKTGGSSAFADDVTEDVTNDFKVIDGGGNPSDNNDDNNNDYNDDLVYLGSASSTALTTLIGKYLTDLYNGKRGDVSKAFLCKLDRKYYFDGTYQYDSYAYIYMPFLGTFICKSCSYPGDWFYLSKGEYAMACNDNLIEQFNNVNEARFCLYKGMETTKSHTDMVDKEGATYYDMKIAYTSKSGVYRTTPFECKICLEHTSESVKFQNTGIGVYTDVCLSNETLQNIGGCPVFESETDAKKYVESGDFSHALNYYVPKGTPKNWYDYDLADIAKQLEKATKMLTQLPQITTDMLHGFAVGVTGATAGVGANTDPNAQEEAVKKAVEESAGNTAKKYYQKTSKKSKEQIEKEMKVTPSPTKTPTKKVEQTDATMMVDLHEFFPFCVPYDLIHLIKCFCAEPQTPKFDINLKLPYIGTIKTCLDLSMFNEGARILRILETIGFILALVLVSRNLIRG